MLGLVARKASRWVNRQRSSGTFDSSQYWRHRYAAGGNSGAGSYGRLSRFKAEVINDFVTSREIASVVEFGCGDGHQLTLASYPAYLGIDVSPEALALCRARFANDSSKRFLLLDDYRGESAELALSLDVIYHLIEDAVFEPYMQRLFGAATRSVIVYASNTDEQRPGQAEHVRHRRFTTWVDQNARDWALSRHIPNRYPVDRRDELETSFADFFVFDRTR